MPVNSGYSVEKNQPDLHCILIKLQVKKKRNQDWSWEDEMLMYDTDQRDTAKRKRIDEKEEHRELVRDGIIDPELEAELRRLKKEKEDDDQYQREERKLFLGKIARDG